MEAFLLILFLLLVLPIILASIALVRTRDLSERMQALEARLARPAAPPSAPVAKPAPMTPPAAEPAVAAPPPVSRRTAVPAPAPAAPPAPPARPSLELALGGKLASFIGIAALVTGVVFFVGYAIQREWIGPGLRVCLGLLAGLVLAGLGYAAERRGERYAVLARALTGGGAALFYFSVFAAHHIYELIPTPVALLGLAVSAGAALALAAFYNSQAVAVLGVLGAFLTPPLIGSRFGVGVFPLVFTAVVNVPVLLLGLRRKWQWLYNLAFLFTAGLAAAWLDRKLPGLSSGAWRTGLGFVLLFHAEFVALGLLRLRTEPADEERPLDQLRLGLSTLALLGALHWIFMPPALHGWIGGIFALAALAHAGLARLGWGWRPGLRHEVMTLLLGAVTFASFAVPVQFDGIWISLGWAIEGAALAGFAVWIGSDLLQGLALFLGVLGLAKSVVLDVSLYAVPPRAFLNGRFAAGLLASGLLGVQGWLQGRSSSARSPDRAQQLAALAALAALVVFFADVFYTMDAELPWPWLFSTAALFAAGWGLVLLAPRASLPGALGIILLMAVPVKIVVDVAKSWDGYCAGFPPFLNGVVAAQLVLLAGLCAPRSLLARQAKPSGDRWPAGEAIDLLARASGILLVTLELHRSAFAWARPAITLWWAGCAMALAVAGILRRRASLRYLALAVFCAAVAKVYLVDLAALKGLQRVAAFIGVGLLLLALSYLYQRLAPLWSPPDSRAPPESSD